MTLLNNIESNFCRRTISLFLFAGICAGMFMGITMPAYAQEELPEASETMPISSEDETIPVSAEPHDTSTPYVFTKPVEVNAHKKYSQKQYDALLKRAKPYYNQMKNDSEKDSFDKDFIKFYDKVKKEKVTDENGRYLENYIHAYDLGAPYTKEDIQNDINEARSYQRHSFFVSFFNNNEHKELEKVVESVNREMTKEKMNRNDRFEKHRAITQQLEKAKKADEKVTNKMKYVVPAVFAVGAVLAVTVYLCKKRKLGLGKKALLSVMLGGTLVGFLCTDIKADQHGTLEWNNDYTQYQATNSYYWPTDKVTAYETFNMTQESVAANGDITYSVWMGYWATKDYFRSVSKVVHVKIGSTEIAIQPSGKPSMTYKQWSRGDNITLKAGETYSVDVYITNIEESGFYKGTITVPKKVESDMIYHGNGGTYDNGKTELRETVKNGTAYKTKENFFTRPGYKFKGWTEIAPDGNRIDWTKWINKDWTWTYLHDAHLYAQWEGLEYNVNYDANGGTGSMKTDTIKCGQPFMTSENMFARSQYRFVGWNEKADGTGEWWNIPGYVKGKYVGESAKGSDGVYENLTKNKWTYTYTHDITLYAQWEKVINITYDTNGGNINTVKNNNGYAIIENGIYGIQSTINTNLYIQSMYQYKDLSPYYLYDQSPSTGNKNTAFYIERYKDTPYYFIQNVNNGRYFSGSGNGQTTNAESGQIPKDYSGLVKKEGGFINESNLYDNEPATDQLYYFKKNSNGTYTIFCKRSNMALDCISSGSSPGTKIQFYRPNGTSAQQFNLITISKSEYLNRIKNNSTSLYVSTSVPVRAGYTFKAWNTNVSGTGTNYRPGDSISGIKSDLNLHAIWTPNNLTIRYHSNGAFGGNVKRSDKWENNVVLDYEQSKDTIVLTETDEEGTSNSTLKQYGLSDYDVKKNDNLYLYRNGYLGTGKYNTKPDGSGIEIDENKTFNSVTELANYLGASIDAKNNSIDLYPQWEEIKYHVNYDANGGTGSMKTDTIKYGQPFMTSKNAFTRSRYKFIGWNEKADGTGVWWNIPGYVKGKYVGTSDVNGKGSEGVYENLTGFKWTYTYTKDITLYAQWEQTTFEITYDTNGGNINTVKNNNGYAIIENGIYEIQSTINTNLYMQSMESRKEYYLLYGQGPNAAFYIERYKDTPYYFIQNVNNGRYFSGSGNGQTTNAESGQIPKDYSGLVKKEGGFINESNLYDNEPATDQLYYFKKNSNGTYTIFCKRSNMALDCISSGSSPGTKIQFYRPNGTSAQQFNLITISKSEYLNRIKNNSTSLYVSTSVPVRAGYTFKAWNTNVSGTGTNYRPGDSISGIKSDLNLHAIWTPNSLTIRYHSNGAFGGNKYGNNSWTNNIVLDYEQSKDTIVITKICKEGFENEALQKFGVTNYSEKRENNLYLYKNGYLGTGKYNTKPDGSGIEIDETKLFNSATELANYLGASIDSKNNSIDLYPQWKAINYSIAYNGNGATSGNMSEQSTTFDKNAELATNNFSRKYTVTYNAMGGTVNAPNNVASATFNGWEDRGDITFMNNNYTYNDFDAPYYSQNYTDMNATYGFDKYNLIKHYVLYGKSEERNPKDKTGKVSLYQNKATVKNLTTTNGYKVNLYANWKLGSVTLPTPTRFGHKFLGWYTSAEGGTKITGATYTPTSNVTLYAHWDLDSYYIDYNANDTGLTDRITDNLTDNNGSLPGKDTVAILTDFALQNGSKYNTKYTFKEWNTKPDGSGQKFTTSITNDGSLCKPGKTLTLYAIWDATPSISAKNFYLIEGFTAPNDVVYSGVGFDKTPTEKYPDKLSEIVYPIKGYTKNGTDITSKIKLDYVEFDGSKTATASIDTKKPGKYTVHYSLTDGKQTKKFTRTITVLPTSAPTINAGDKYFKVNTLITADLLKENVSVNDKYDGDLIDKVVIENIDNIQSDKDGVYQITYKVTIRVNKTATKTVNIFIIDYLPDNRADEANKFRFVRKDCSEANDYCLQYFNKDSKWAKDETLRELLMNSLSKSENKTAIKKFELSSKNSSSKNKN